MVTFTVSINTSSLLSNKACCTVTFRTCSNTSSLIGGQVVYRLILADYRVPIKFKVKHMRVCDEACHPSKYGILLLLPFLPVVIIIALILVFIIFAHLEFCYQQ
jgi:hypothetical protein